MEELEAVLGALMAEGRIVPVTLGSAIRSIGVERLTTLLDEIAVSHPIPALVEATSTASRATPRRTWSCGPSR